MPVKHDYFKVKLEIPEKKHDCQIGKTEIPKDIVVRKKKQRMPQKL